MKIVTWNCQGAYRKKAARIAAHAPDLAVIQECERLDKLDFERDGRAPVTQQWFGDHAFKGLGVFSYTGLRFELYAGYDASIRYCVPLKVSGPFNFNLIAVWAMAHSDRRQSYIGQVYRALERYGDFMAEADSVLVGDFNSNKIWDGMPRLGNHSAVVDALAGRDIVSAYHEHFHEPHGEETRSTFYLYRHKRKAYHLDYCFVPRRWMKHLTSVRIGPYRQWSSLSDHTPLFAEFDWMGDPSVSGRESLNRKDTRPKPPPVLHL